MKKIFFIFSLLLSINDVQAQSCIPKPDCADMGYTKTSCGGAYLKCPFDTTKLACLADENAGRLCLVGYIYYSDGTCDSVVYSTKTPIGIVVKPNKLVMSLDIKENMYWASSYKDISDLTNYSQTDSSKADYNGKANTAKIVTAYSSDTASNNAAKYCNSYSTTGTSAGQWYLPATGEIYMYVYKNVIGNSALRITLNTLGKDLSDMNFWSSSEYDSGRAWAVYYNSDNVVNHYKNTFQAEVICFLEI